MKKVLKEFFRPSDRGGGDNDYSVIFFAGKMVYTAVWNA